MARACLELRVGVHPRLRARDVGVRGRPLAMAQAAQVKRRRSNCCSNRESGGRRLGTTADPPRHLHAAQAMAASWRVSRPPCPPRWPGSPKPVPLCCWRRLLWAGPGLTAQGLWPGHLRTFHRRCDRKASRLLVIETTRYQTAAVPDPGIPGIVLSVT